MPLDPQFRAILDTLENSGLTPLVRGDAAQTREHYQTLSLSRRGPGFVPEPVASVADLRSPGGVPVRVYEPASSGGFTLIYLHGGGWVVGNVETHDPLCRRVANQTGARVVSVDYRLAPEHPFPAALDDAEEVLRWLLAQDPGRPVGVAGDSAGASLAAGLAIRARDQRLPLAAQLLLYPATDPAMTSASITANGEGYFLTRHDMAWFYQQYLPDGVASGTAAAEADLTRADVAGVAPAIVATAEFDPLRDEGAAYAARLRDAGVPVEYVPGPGLIHGFAGFLGVVDAAEVNLEKILASLSRAMRSQTAPRSPLGGQDVTEDVASQRSPDRCHRIQKADGQEHKLERSFPDATSGTRASRDTPSLDNNGVDSGYVADLVHYRPPNQPHNPDRPH